MKRLFQIIVLVTLLKKIYQLVGYFITSTKQDAIDYHPAYTSTASNYRYSGENNLRAMFLN